MPHIIVVLIVVAAAFWGSNLLSGLAPAAKERALRKVGGYVALGAATFLLLKGQTEVALGLGGLGLYLLGFSGSPHWSGFFKRDGAAAGDLRSTTVAMEPDLRSGAVVSGAFGGRNLGELSLAECMALYRAASVTDPPGARLLEAYFDRRFPGWRGAVNGDADARGRGGSGKMTEDEAYEVLGLAKGASEDDISRAHRALMKRLHPDQGGTTSLAARVNEARDKLIRRHG
jgi:hypothetical protein